MLQSHTKAVLIMGTKWSLGGRRVMTRCSPGASRKLVLTQPWATDRRVCNKQLAVRVQHWRIRYFLTVRLRKVSQKEGIECKRGIQKTKRKKKSWQKYSWQKYRVCSVGKGWDVVAWQISIFAHQIGPRSDEKVYEMLEAQTNCTFLSLVSLVNYGNWCGPGSNGREPVDDVDTCCQVLTPFHPILDFSYWTLPKGHDMCYDTIDKSGLCDGLHPALVTYHFEPTANGTIACTDCSGEDLLNEEKLNEEVACHCKVIGQSSYY